MTFYELQITSCHTCTVKKHSTMHVSAFCLNSALLQRQAKEQHNALQTLKFTSFVTSWGWFTRQYVCFLRKSASSDLAASRNFMMEASTPEGYKCAYPSFSEGHFAIFLTLIHAIISSNFNSMESCCAHHFCWHSFCRHLFPRCRWQAAEIHNSKREKIANLKHANLRGQLGKI